MRDLDGLDLVMFREGYDLRAVTLAACAEAGVEPHLVSEGAEMAGVLSLWRPGSVPRWCPAIALPADGSLVGIPSAAHTRAAPSPWPERGDRALARPARALAEQLLGRRPPGSAAPTPEPRV